MLPFRGALDGTEDIRDLTVEGCSLEVDYTAAGVEDDINRCAEGRQVPTDGLAHAALDAIAFDSLAHDFADGESDAGACGVCVTQRRAVGAQLGAQGEKVGHLPGELFAPGLVDALVVSVFAKTEDDGFGGHTAGLDLMSVESRMTQF